MDGLAPVAVWFGEARVWVGLSDGRALGAPIGWFPRLAAATPVERSHFVLTPFGVSWAWLEADLMIGTLERLPGVEIREGAVPPLDPPDDQDAADERVHPRLKDY